MINIQKIDHIGIRVRAKERSVAFYEMLGFHFSEDLGFDEGYPIKMHHPAGFMINLLSVGESGKDENILMDVVPRYTGYTHIALRVDSIEQVAKFCDEQNYTITERMEIKGMKALFIRDPDRNVIEFDECI